VHDEAGGGVSAQPVFVENRADYERSRQWAIDRAQAGDDTLEICPVCMCEVDADPQPHKPGCEQIGKPRSTSEPVLTTFMPARAAKPVIMPDSPIREVAAVAAATEPALEAEAVLEGRELKRLGPTRSRPSSPVRGAVWSPDDVIAAIRRWADEHGGVPPTNGQWVKKVDGYPSSSTCQDRFGSWSKAIEAAGFVARKQGGAPRPTLSEREPSAPDPDADLRVPGPPALPGVLQEAAPAGPAPGPASRSENADPDQPVAGLEHLSFAQLVAAGNAMAATAEALLPLAKEDRRAVWLIVGPLVEGALR
jgi:hypothetical protein